MILRRWEIEAEIQEGLGGKGVPAIEVLWATRHFFKASAKHKAFVLNTAYGDAVRFSVRDRRSSGSSLDE